MARLNEPPQPAVESIDALKRRFVRQNRELARANSTQSLRIRSLEGEVSRLLSENVSLREQIIKIHKEAEKNTSNAMLEGVQEVKIKLETKLTDLGVLVKELGDVQNKVEKQFSKKRKSLNRNSPKRSPDQRNWKNALTLTEVTGGMNNRLPPIIEDKYYPRRTLDAEDLLSVLADTDNITDSPDLGPPPVAHFEEGDPIQFDPDQEQAVRRKSIEGIEEEQSSIFANLETRKKRRESSHRGNINVETDHTDLNRGATSGNLVVPADEPFKSGAKRKLHVRDSEDPPKAASNPVKQPLQHHRRKIETRPESRQREADNAKSSNNTSSKATSDRIIQRPKSTDLSVLATTNSNRKALGPKSVNTDSVNSPIKMRSSSKDNVAEAKDELVKLVREKNRLNDRSQPKAIEHGKQKQLPANGDPVKKAMEVPPKTPLPAPDDLFSPNASEPSAGREESRDTPPPPELGPDTGNGSFGRASRRPKGSVNYAQPNLRDKMRRPTKELVDAVGAEERARQIQADKDASTKMYIKREEEAEALPNWKSNVATDNQKNRKEPTSPLHRKSGGTALDFPTANFTDGGRQIPVPRDTENGYETSKRSSGAASTIAALTAGTQRSNLRETTTAEAGNEQGDNMPGERQSIYDFTGSSPGEALVPGIDKESSGDTTKTSRSSRRHSSVSAKPDAVKGSISITRRGERKREVPISANLESDLEAKDRGQLARAKSILELGPGSNEPTTMSRGERAASRRRSMML